MSFSMKRALAVFWKDALDLRKNKGLLASLFVLPAVMVVVPVGIVFSYLRSPDTASLRVLAQYYDPAFPADADPARFLVDRALADWFGVYLIMPVFVPVLISSHAIAGEKERRTLEPLLASPITGAELVIGKSLASLVPAFVISVAAFAVLCVLIDAAAWPYVGEPLLPNGMWLFGVLVIAPLFAFFGNGVAVLISARVGDARLAQQLAGLLTLPIIGLVGLQIAGFLRAGVGYYALLGGVVLLMDLVIVALSVRVFDRERLISKWT